MATKVIPKPKNPKATKKKKGSNKSIGSMPVASPVYWWGQGIINTLPGHP